MQSLWNESEASPHLENPVALRAYTSRLLGQEPSLVLHGGGNTSVKVQETNLFGETEDILYVKGSGWDLATIQPAGFAPVKMDALLKMSKLNTLSDSGMVTAQKSAMTNPSAPTPSVEAILHAIIPFKYVDHTHADAVVAISNTPGGYEKLKKIFGKKTLILPYIMPGFILAKQVADETKTVDWKSIDGIILMHHGVFTFANDARLSYEKMITLVDAAEKYIQSVGAWEGAKTEARETSKTEALQLSQIRVEVSKLAGAPMLAHWNRSAEAIGFSNLDGVSEFSTRGPITPDHVIHTKQVPAIFDQGIEPQETLAEYSKTYKNYFQRNTNPQLKILDAAPRWAVWKGRGTLAFGSNAKRTRIIADISRHTVKAVQWGEKMGGWEPLDEKSIFEVEYWELEQAKLKKTGGATSFFEGKVALVTGAASGIGLACAKELQSAGAVVIALDLQSQISDLFKGVNALGLVCDITDTRQLESALLATAENFGGLDIVVSNAGSFPASKKIADLEDQMWERSLELNLSSHMKLLRACVPFLKNGLDPSFVIIGSKNVPAPGPGAAAYSVAKAGLAQLARVAALELGEYGIRVNTVHPNAVFDTGIWTPDILANRAKHYGMSVEQYKTNNVLHREVTSRDVAKLVLAMAGPEFSKTTGSQVPIDGGNDRVI